MQTRFNTKKRQILEQIDVPDEVYTDLSPKGSIDEPIRSLIDDINRLNGLVTTSSCSGRISVFLEGRKKSASDAVPDDEGEQTRAGPGGKGGGSSWLFISHNPVEVPTLTSDLYFMNLFGLQYSSPRIKAEPAVNTRFIHFKFEPMILHVLTASLEEAHKLVTVAMSSGFRESGALSLLPSKTGETNPMVAVRSTGYSFDSIIGYQDVEGNNVSLVHESHLRLLVNIANERFNVNTERISRFHSSLMELQKHSITHQGPRSHKSLNSPKSDWEDLEVRRQRKKEEGLLRKRALQKETAPALAERTSNNPDTELDGLFD
ncbi:hypothetical protein GQ43DRAFT_376430 [Delitschia confertaspora ATCC 74209]|uniref:tRNA wybutosine-synthesizing protein 3 n=1 Tax=Delitschia confertaspora ATCC 74209 TaxID=1513339 RepID=A0A9P4MND5_9PLEO|nr:hypothetical protein GQ43DRAFT_376430 [Delitschia confertaspora ATCC 74209]